MEIVQVPAWTSFAWLRHGFSTRADGFSEVYGPAELNLGFTRDDDRETVLRNRACFLEQTGCPAALATVSQVHSNQVLAVDAGGRAGEGDGLITAAAGVTVGVLTADCVPVLLADTRLRVVGAVHAGWRGTATGIALQGVAQMAAVFGSRAEDLVAAVGPSIGACCYQVGPEFRERFAADLFVDGDRLDLWEANRRQLVEAGVPAGQVTVIGECTGCTRVAGRLKYFSHRVERGFTGRSMAVVGVV